MSRVAQTTSGTNCRNSLKFAEFKPNLTDFERFFTGSAKVPVTEFTPADIVL